MDQIPGLVVNYGISNTVVLEIPYFTTRPARWCSRCAAWSIFSDNGGAHGARPSAATPVSTQVIHVNFDVLFVYQWFPQHFFGQNGWVDLVLHDDVIKWKHFPCYWPFVGGIHRSSVNSPHKGQWHQALMFSLICVWINGGVNNCEAGDLRYRAHYDDTIMFSISLKPLKVLDFFVWYANVLFWHLSSEVAWHWFFVIGCWYCPDYTNLLLISQ